MIAAAAAPDPTFWNNLAEEYAAKPVDDPAAFERKIAITQGRMGPGAVVLDIGCGTGSLALRLAETGADVHGLDLSDEMIRIARGKARAQEVDNVTFHVGAFDERFSAFADGSLDGICAYSILHLVPDRQAALAQIFRLLKPGGFFISSTVCLRNSWFPYGPMLTVMRGEQNLLRTVLAPVRLQHGPAVTLLPGRHPFTCMHARPQAQRLLQLHTQAGLGAQIAGLWLEVPPLVTVKPELREARRKRFDIQHLVPYAIGARHVDGRLQEVLYTMSLTAPARGAEEQTATLAQ